MERKQIEKQYIKRNSLISFTLDGDEICENINYDELEHLLDATFQNMKSYEDMPRNVSWIRTILKDLKEKNLIIEVNSIENQVRKEYLIGYKKNQLTYFEYTQSMEYAKNEKDKFKVRYDLNTGIKFQIPALDRIEEYEQVKDLIGNMIELLKKLENPMSVTLNHDSKLLCDIYKTFYQENPDFSDKDVRIKVQTMMSILEEFGITTKGALWFAYYPHNIRFPISLGLESLVDELAPLGEIKIIEESIQLSEKEKNIIQTVGHILSEHTPDIPGELMKISRILYARRNQLPWASTNQEMASYTKTSLNEVETTMRLVKRIKERLK